IIANSARSTARRNGWPKNAAPSSAGRLGLPLNVLALSWGGGMLVSFARPRAASNPTPLQTGLGLNFHWHWLNDRPVFWTVLVVVAAVGAAYFTLVQRTKRRTCRLRRVRSSRPRRLKCRRADDAVTKRGWGRRRRRPHPLRSARDRRAPRSRRVLRRRGGARGPVAPHEAPRRRRRSARSRRRGNGELRGAEVRDPLRDELRRGAPAMSARRVRAP